MITPTYSRGFLSSGLSPTLENFCVKYSSGLKLSQCVRNSTTATWAMKRPGVQQKIREYQLEIKKLDILTLDAHLKKLAQIRDLCIKRFIENPKSSNLSAAVQAEALRGKAAGLYVERLDNYAMPINSQYENLTNEQIEKEIEARGLAQYIPDFKYSENVDDLIGEFTEVKE